MFLVEEKMAPSGACCAIIYMRPDGLFEGRIYPSSRTNTLMAGAPEAAGTESFEMCCVTDTLLRAQSIVYEEIGL